MNLIVAADENWAIGNKNELLVRDYSSRLEGRSAGIGVEVETDPESGYLLITEVYPNSPAQTEGLQKGDKIVAIGGDTVTAENSSEMADSAV